jgi:hypothetical protein
MGWLLLEQALWVKERVREPGEAFFSAAEAGAPAG